MTLRRVWCPFCQQGEYFGTFSEGDEWARAHIETCTLHPLKIKIAELEQVIESLTISVEARGSKLLILEEVILNQKKQIKGWEKDYASMSEEYSAKLEEKDKIILQHEKSLNFHRQFPAAAECSLCKASYHSKDNFAAVTWMNEHYASRHSDTPHVVGEEVIDQRNKTVPTSPRIPAVTQREVNRALGFYRSQCSRHPEYSAMEMTLNRFIQRRNFAIMDLGDVLRQFLKEANAPYTTREAVLDEMIEFINEREKNPNIRMREE